MRTNWRARTARVAIAVVAAAIAAFGIAAPANAAPPQIAGFPPSLTVAPRSEFQLEFQIINDLASGDVAYTVDYDHSVFQCLERCGGNVLLGSDNVYALRMVTVVGRIFPEETHSPITLSAPSLPASKTADITITKNEIVPEISGKVFDVALGDPINDAKVELTDAVGQTWEQFTDPQGLFSFTSEEGGKQIAKGEIKLLVSKQDYQDLPTALHNNSQFTNLRLQMIKLTTGETNPGTTDSATQSFGAAPTTTTEHKDDGGLSSGSIAIIVVGGLLVVTGVVAIVLLFGKRDNGGPGGKSRPGGGGRGGPAGPGRGTPSPPRRAAPGSGAGTGAVPRPGYGAQRPGGTTTISRSPLADNPTQTRPRSPGQPPYSAAPPPGFGGSAPRPPQGGQPGYGTNPRSAPPAGGYGQPGYGGQAGPGGQPGRPAAPPSGFGAPTGPATGPDPRRARADGRRVDWMDD